ncbi:hypothetical protein [Rhodanobacter sp. DHB23]|uniref:hypothetical protein n=1 Tax=Rhodanobacter sp. DHB23 TaxID=2775923 RepID=UPI00177DAD83|nr:hypothetical protein [Rhodanobacter sp. DHB23]MBD8873426.1 hypothetical protein [Rhodanobacter sp. DHB23]
METVCQACGYQRKPTDQAPDWECPACGKAYSKTSHGSPASLPVKAQNSSPDPDNPHVGEGACANYLATHYCLPQTYRDAFLRRVVIPVLATTAMLTMIVLLTAVFLGPVKRQGLSIGWLIFPFDGLALLVVCYVASMIWRSMTIRADSIEIVQASSTRVIRAVDVLGYATDYVHAGRSSGWRYAFVCRQYGQPEERMYFVLGPDNLKDPRLLGLFRAMHNYGNSSLDKLLGEVMSGEQRKSDQFIAGMLFLIDLYMTWSFWPLICTMLRKM